MTNTTANFVVGIPTLWRYDCLKQCLSSILLGSLLPREICVVDNGGHFDEAVFRGTRDCRVRVVKPGYNLGVAGSWNLLHSLYAPQDVVYANDDILFEPEALRRLVSCDGDFVPAMPGQAWSCFLQRERVWSTVGDYDDGFWPAYFEDNDYARRMALAGIERSHPQPRAVVSHSGSATGGLAFARFGWNQGRYGAKWGGPPDGEAFTRPWNGEEHDELEFYFQRCCSFPTDISEHCPTLSRLAGECDHVTEFGTGTGTSTTALLHGGPRRLVCYDINHVGEFDNVVRLGRRPDSRTSFVFHEQNSLEADIEPTDLLFIDTLHVTEQLRAELAMHERKVRRYIALHDTATFGGRGEWTGHGGLLPALDEFVERHPEWSIKERFDNNNGLTVLARQPSTISVNSRP